MYRNTDEARMIFESFYCTNPHPHFSFGEGGHVFSAPVCPFMSCLYESETDPPGQSAS